MRKKTGVHGLLTAGNLECADCGDRGKTVVKFCSVKLGVFLCNQCYAAHRALGAHVSRVKCIGLDKFSDAEVDLLTRRGNAVVNQEYEAHLPAGAKPPPTPCNGCSSSTCRDCKERLQFIKEKYENRRWYAAVVSSAGTAIDPPLPSSSAPSPNECNDDDPFGLFQPSTTTSSTPPTNQQSASSKNTDFFAAFGL